MEPFLTTTLTQPSFIIMVHDSGWFVFEPSRILSIIEVSTISEFLNIKNYIDEYKMLLRMEIGTVAN